MILMDVFFTHKLHKQHNRKHFSAQTETRKRFRKILL